MAATLRGLTPAWKFALLRKLTPAWWMALVG
jgi:hypothetical protein